MKAILILLTMTLSSLSFADSFCESKLADLVEAKATTLAYQETLRDFKKELNKNKPSSKHIVIVVDQQMSDESSDVINDSDLDSQKLEERKARINDLELEVAGYENELHLFDSAFSECLSIKLPGISDHEKKKMSESRRMFEIKKEIKENLALELNSFL